MSARNRRRAGQGVRASPLVCHPERSRALGSVLEFSAVGHTPFVNRRWPPDTRTRRPPRMITRGREHPRVRLITRGREHPRVRPRRSGRSRHSSHSINFTGPTISTNVATHETKRDLSANWKANVLVGLIHYHCSNGCCACGHCERAERLTQALRRNRIAHARCTSPTCSACSARRCLVSCARENVHKLKCAGADDEASILEDVIRTRLEAAVAPEEVAVQSSA